MEKLVSQKNKKDFKILVLDGGGSKGIYTLGILLELELKLGSPLCNHFNLIYGTSTGSIIASLIAMGKTILEIKEIYLKHIPTIMSGGSRKTKSVRLKFIGDEIFKDVTFENLKTDIGIVALNYDTQNPLIFKSNIIQAHGMKQSFIPGFGCSISDAVQASCSAYPIFSMKVVNTSNQGKINAIDGGFIANNSTLFALIDADKAFKISHEKIKVVSVGTGNFVEKPLGGFFGMFRYFKVSKFIERVFTSSTNTNVTMTNLIYSHLPIVRLNDIYNEPEYGTNMIENDLIKLEKLYQLGRKCFAKFEREIDNLLI